MLATKQERNLPGVEDIRSSRFDHVEGAVGRTERKLKVSRVEHGRVFGKIVILEH